MTDLGHFASSSSSSNLSPLAPPFTVERSTRSKLNSILGIDSNFNGKSDGVTYSSIWPNFHSSITTQGLSADSIRTATVLAGNPMYPNPINPPSTCSNDKSGLIPVVQAAGQSFGANSTFPNPINLPSMCSNDKSGLKPINQAAGQSIGANSTYPNPISSPNTHHWSNNKSGLEPINQAAGQSFGANSSYPNTHDWSSQFDPINSPNTHNWSSHSNTINSPNTHNWSSMNSNIKSGLEPINQSFDHSFEIKKHNTMWNFSDNGSDDDAPMMPLNFDLLPNTSLFGDYGTSSSQAGYSQSLFGSKYNGQPGTSQDSMFGPSIIGRSHDTSIFATNNGLVSSGFSKENTITSNGPTSHYPFETTRSIIYDSFRDHISITKSPPSVVIKPSEQLDHHNSAEDSPCWKGAPNQLQSSSSSSSGSGSCDPEPELSDKKGNHHYLHLSVNNPHDLAKAGSLDVTNTLRSLINLSEFLLLHCSMGETALKEAEHLALDHVIATLIGCMSKRIQKVDADQERKNDKFNKELQRVDDNLTIKKVDDPDDYNMIQKIKKVLDENLECKEENLPSDTQTLLYKNLWLETEAELCALNYKARFNRVKREMEKFKASVPDVLKIGEESNLVNVTEKDHADVKASDDAVVMKLTEDVDRSVMARFNVLKCRVESDPVDIKASDDALTEDVDPLVLARFSILKRRGVEEQVLKSKLWFDSRTSFSASS